MAWAERLPSGKWRGCWRDPDGRKNYTKRPEFPEHPYARKRDAVEAAQEAEVKARRKAAARQGTASASMPFGEWWEHTTTNRDDTGAGHVTDSVGRTHLLPKWETTALNMIKQREVKLWVADLVAKYEASYVRTVYGRFRHSINLAVEEGVLDASPCVGVKLPKVRKRVKAYADEEHLAVIAPHLPRHYRDMNDFALETGLRPGEVCGLHADVIQEKTGWVTVRAVYVEKVGVIRMFPKDDDERHVPLTQTALEIIRRNLDDRDLTAGCGVPHADGRVCRSALVFVTSRRRTATTPDGWWCAMRDAAEAAKVERRTPYSVRRGFATRAARGGLDAFEIAEIMGHSDIRQTQQYVQQTPAVRDRMRAALGGSPS